MTCHRRNTATLGMALYADHYGHKGAVCFAAVGAGIHADLCPVSLPVSGQGTSDGVTLATI